MSGPTRDIVVEAVLPHSLDAIWKALTTGDLIAKWLMPNTFEPIVGHKFTFKAPPIGDWDGTVQCQVLEIAPKRRIVYSWGGGEGSMPAMLDSVVIWTLREVEGGVQVRMVHSGFRSPENDMAFNAMSPGWSRIVLRVGDIAGEIA